jgi:nucleoside-diphosphate-sugar epimerase
MAFDANRDTVTVLDGFLPRSGARSQNLLALQQPMVIRHRVEEHPALSDLVAGHSVIVDCMGWTCHRLALKEPGYDLELNLQSHLHLLNHLPESWEGRIIYLGSRGQYGNPKAVEEITEDTVQQPEDVQGVHKVAAESHFRLAARFRGFPVASLRIPAVVGPHQPIIGEDIGLFAGFVRDLWAGKTVELYGAHRRRAVVHVDDIAATVVRLVDARWEGFQPFNVAGHSVVLSVALQMFQKVIGRGDISVRPAPPEIAAIDIGGTPVSESRLANLLGELPRRSVEKTLQAAVEPFRT